VILSEWAAIAIENARLYEVSERRRAQSETTSRHLRLTRDVAVAIGAETQLERILELIADRGRALVNARSVVLWLRDGGDLLMRAAAGQAAMDADDVRVAIGDSELGGVLERQTPARVVSDSSDGYAPLAGAVGVGDGESALLVPLLRRGHAVGVLVALGGCTNGGGFTDDDEQLLETFAVSAATGLALAQSVESERVRSAMASAEAERGRWARELHDETLQSFARLRILLGSALRRDDTAQMRDAVRESIQDIERGIENLRAIITELRPAALDELGLLAAIESLLARHRDVGGPAIESELSIRDPDARRVRLERELESAVYRLLQEALTNVRKHSGARNVRVRVHESDTDLRIEVNDDGRGFDPETTREGFGLDGMSERASLAGGTLEILSDEDGTRVRARLPVRTDGPRGAPSEPAGRDQGAPAG